MMIIIKTNRKKIIKCTIFENFRMFAAGKKHFYEYLKIIISSCNEIIMHRYFKKLSIPNFPPNLKKIVLLMWNNGCKRMRSNESGYKVC